MVWRSVGLRAAAAVLLDLPRLDSRQLCRLDASREDVVHAQVRTELIGFLIMNRSPGPDACGSRALINRALTPSEIPRVNVERTPGRAGARRCRGAGCGIWTAEHDLAGGAELALVLGKALRHPRLIGNGVLAKPHRVWRAGIRILLRVGDGWERSYDRNE